MLESVNAQTDGLTQGHQLESHTISSLCERLGGLTIDSNLQNDYCLPMSNIFNARLQCLIFVFFS